MGGLKGRYFALDKALPVLRRQEEAKVEQEETYFREAETGGIAYNLWHNEHIPVEELNHEHNYAYKT